MRALGKHELVTGVLSQPASDFAFRVYTALEDTWVRGVVLTGSGSGLRIAYLELCRDQALAAI